jgi:hypothetical protein
MRKAYGWSERTTRGRPLAEGLDKAFPPLLTMEVASHL